MMYGMEGWQGYALESLTLYIITIPYLHLSPWLVHH
jgi:hypothetical protein